MLRCSISRLNSFRQIIPKTKKTIDQLVLNHNYYLLENSNLKNNIKRLESKVKRLKDNNNEMKRIIYIMADVD